MPDFQHRHYAAVAKVIADLPKHHDKTEIIGSFDKLFADDNPRYDSKRFIAAAIGTPSNKRDAR